MRYSKMYEALTKVLEKDEQITFAMTDVTSRQIELWSLMFKERAPWINEDTKSMGLPSAISCELARLITLEMESKITGSSRATFLDSHYQKQIRKLRQFTELACAKGGIIFKPYVTENGLATQIVQADSFFPITFDDSGNITRICFVEQFRKANSIYTRVEYHKLEGTRLTIRNRAFKSDTDGILGSEISLESTERWSDLAEEITIENVTKLPIGYFKVPLANNKDADSPLGVSCFSRGTDLIHEADIRYSQISWEFESKETAIHIGESLLKYDKNQDKLVYPGGKGRLYRAMEYSQGAVDKPLLDAFSPDIRDTSYFNGLNQQLRRIEFACCLAYGTLSDPNNEAKTAEEIKTSKQRSYTFVSDCQKALQDALEDYIDAMDLWCTIYDLVPQGSHRVSFIWDDSLVVDTEKERQTDRSDVAMGAMQLWEYRMKWFGETEEEAKKAVGMNDQTALIDDMTE